MLGNRPFGRPDGDPDDSIHDEDDEFDGPGDEEPDGMVNPEKDLFVAYSTVDGMCKQINN